jgi:N-acetylmuramoyl-L-alanine amidase
MGHNKSKALSEIMQRHMIAEMRLRDRGVKTGRFQVIRQALVPASLVELAFISNPLEEAMLGSTEGQARAARALAEGIREFLQVRLHVPQDQI